MEKCCRQLKVGIGVYIFGACLVFSSPIYAQFFATADSIDSSRISGVAIGTTVAAAGTFIGLNELWYANYPRSRFHFFNDNDEWLQMDKAGHALSGYQIGRSGYNLLRWSGVKTPLAIWAGGNLGLIFLTGIEILDGTSAQWGFSLGDMGANVLGSALFVSQQLTWQEQRFSIKFSYNPNSLTSARPAVLGSNDVERIFKDYNAQTIWLSANPSSFISNGNTFLPWLNVAFGYGADDMLGGRFMPQYNEAGAPLKTLKPVRQYYLGLDLDLTRIKTNSHFLKTVFNTFGFLKIPAPAIEMKQGSISWHWLMF